MKSKTATTSNPPYLAVVIVNWNRPFDTLECVQSILREERENLEIIVVDNGSTDDSIPKIRNAFPAITLISLASNLGFSRGYNTGIEQALQGRAQLILLLNNDTALDPKALKTLSNSNWDVAVPKILYYDNPERIWAAGCRWRNIPPSVAIIGFGKKDQPKYDNPRPLDFATGCAVLVHRKVFETINGFDADLANYMEDYDFCFRARQAGFRIGYVPSARVRHKVSQTLGEYSKERWQHQGRNTVLFYRKDKRFPLIWLMVFIIWVSIREALKGHFQAMFGFWIGVRHGFRYLKTIKTRSNRMDL
jgi:GT2 family glycosyltransferase